MKQKFWIIFGSNLSIASWSNILSSFIYADEADLLNAALFGKTAKQWQIENLKAKGNIRDEATLEQLVVLSNIESINSVLIHQGVAQNERLMQLNTIAISQMKSLLGNTHLKKISEW